ncbi:MAG: protein-export chaperone SecB [Gammaproteobacteria bacterium]|uniref:Protein-export protein SecB n=1 Tax=OM182 bacterium MED-G24 TaxID=1986255 RepID=A0A2A5WTY7_9GAMM|nr:protein-export chaperone SecB [Gammaproteobacteria bacterium]PDH39723.1 MAG: protein-export chaperone SecB [OM182 bacterium MED-G24]RPG27433.1 MAG: protein-export chaperone SecB [Gammaproteobacteria bacterium TMED50]|tara:strand:+ start:262 stop:723 length:462 start_codon:yes stop_codon:yes gene_type:complete
MSEQGESNQEAQFALQRIYLKDASFESPKAPHSFRGDWQPKINLELNVKNNHLEGDLYEVVLTLTITATTEAESEDDPYYLVEIQQAGVFLIKGSGDVLSQAMGSYCPSVLFPYARETVDAMVTRGSFPPLMLAPVNFDAIYQESRVRAERPH